MKNSHTLIVLFAFLFLSCSQNEDALNIIQEQNQIQFEDTAISLEDFTNESEPKSDPTWCTIVQYSRMDENNMVQYQYRHSPNIRINVTYEWTVLSGDIEIVSGGDTDIVTVLFKDDLDTAVLMCSGYENRAIVGLDIGNLCNVPITITRMQ